MDKIKVILERQISQRHHDTQIRKYREEQLDQLCNLVDSWIVSLTEIKWNQVGTDRILHLRLLEEDTLELRFSPQLNKHSHQVSVSITIFNMSQPRQRTQLLLSWQPKKQQWRILFFKRKNRWFPQQFFRRNFSKSFFESSLIDFLHITY